MAKNEPKNCWAYFNCPKRIRGDCPAYQTDMGSECWYVMDVKKGCAPARKLGIGSCFDCPWFKKLNPKH